MNTLDEDIGIISRAIIDNVDCEFYVKRESDDSSTHYSIYLPEGTNVEWANDLMNSENISKSDLIKKGYKVLGNEIFKTWSCYLSGKMQCGKCESCNNRKIAFAKAKIEDKTKYLK